jgi:hypothetical protein
LFHQLAPECPPNCGEQQKEGYLNPKTISMKKARMVDSPGWSKFGGDTGAVGQVSSEFTLRTCPDGKGNAERTY